MLEITVGRRWARSVLMPAKSRSCQFSHFSLRNDSFGTYPAPRTGHESSGRGGGSTRVGSGSRPGSGFGERCTCLGRKYISEPSSLSQKSRASTRNCLGAVKPEFPQQRKVSGVQLSDGLQTPLVDDSDEVEVLHLLPIPFIVCKTKSLIKSGKRTRHRFHTWK